MINHQGEYSTHLVSWKSVAAGFIVTLFTMTALLGLGIALGDIGIDENVSVEAASIFTSLWFLSSIILSIFVGSYYSVRLSSYRVAANGLLIACLFILFFFIQAFSIISTTSTSIVHPIASDLVLLK